MYLLCVCPPASQLTVLSSASEIMRTPLEGDERKKMVEDSCRLLPENQLCLGCILVTCCCDKTPRQRQRNGEGFVLALVQSVMAAGIGGSCSHRVHGQEGQEAGNTEGWSSACFLLVIQFRTSLPHMMPPHTSYGSSHLC